MLPLLLWACTPAPSPPAAPPSHVGSAACVPCHADQHAAWSSSHHALAERDWREAPPLPEALAGVEVVRWIGVDPLTQPLLRAASGRLQASSLAWDPHAQQWFDIFGDERRQPGEWGHTTGRGMTWNTMCAQCHVTGLDRGWSSTTDTFTTTFSEAGVGCEACHGPASQHVHDPRQRTPGPTEREAVAETCEACHLRWSPLTDAHRAGEPLLDHGVPVLPGMDAGWYPDGQVLAESFEAVAFRQSRMHEAGVRCVDCHDPHSGAPPRTGDALCLGCHTSQPSFQPAHSQHSEVSCVACHMPTTTYMARHVRHDHGFSVPDAGLAAKLGLPVACDRCHTLTPELVATSERWWQPDAPRRDRTTLLARAWSGDRTTCAPLAALLSDRSSAPPSAPWRAVLATALRDCPEAEPALLTASHDPDPWLRAAAAAALPPTATPRLTALLADPVRAVRFEAARGLQGQLPPTDPRMAELRSTLEAHADHVVHAAALGAWWSQAGRPDQALPHLERAVQQDPHQPELRRALAVVLSALGRHGEAARQLEPAVRAFPDDAELAFSLALAAAAAERFDDAVAAFELALRADPNHARAAYNLGLLYHQLDRPDAALALLHRAATLSATDPAPPYAAATILLRLGRRAEATAAATEALRRDPQHPGARELLQHSAR